MANSHVSVPFAWFDAAAPDESEAEAMAFEVNARRAEARAMARRR